ncbi:MAG TPA: DNA polymerase/3'-5' exonuclease PolX [Chloroflexota bacterium]|nr:DNA polymerase/3'-5' exonuclease PolX [Chloroflexota bacterium]
MAEQRPTDQAATNEKPRFPPGGRPAITPSDANRAAAKVLEQIATYLSIAGENPYRVRAYQEAATHIRAMAISILDLWRHNQLREIPGVGPSIAQKLGEFLRTGRSPYLEELQRTLPRGIERLLDIDGVGPARARILARELNVHTPEELVEAARAHHLRTLPGFGAKLEERLLLEAQRWSQRERRLLIGVAWPVAEELVESLRVDPIIRRVSAAGSLRRMKETIGDIDLLAAAVIPADATDHFTRLPVVREVLALGPTKATVLLEDDLQVDLRVVEPKEWGAALQHFTGSKEHNIALRDIAIGKGLRLNEYGIFEEPSGRRLGGETEEEIYHTLGMDWIPPEMRENRGEIAAAQAHRLPTLVELADLRGDLHIHTNWSDGTASLREMARAARDAGLSYIALTDHSPSLAVAHGLSIDRLREQWQLIEEVNRELAPFRVLRSSEIDIKPDGSLDLPDEILRELDYVGVSVHTNFNMPREEMTRRIVKAIQNPYVTTLNHPTGRLINRRPGYAVDLETVLRAAAAADVALEINSQFNRLDLDDVWARRAKELGCRLTIDSDSHGVGNFQTLRYGAAVARRAWRTSRDILNTLPLDGLLAYLRQRRQRTAA